MVISKKKQSNNRITLVKNRNISCHTAECCHNSCSKCPPFARTHARRRPRQSLTAKHAENAASVHNTSLDEIVWVFVQKSKNVTFSSAFSSKYAKTRTSNFRKVVRQHTEGMVESIIWVLYKIYLDFRQWKNFENPLNYWQSYRHEFGVLLFLGHSVYNVCCRLGRSTARCRLRVSSVALCRLKSSAFIVRRPTSRQLD